MVCARMMCYAGELLRTRRGILFCESWGAQQPLCSGLEWGGGPDIWEPREEKLRGTALQVHGPGANVRGSEPVHPLRFGRNGPSSVQLAHRVPALVVGLRSSVRER